MSDDIESCEADAPATPAELVVITGLSGAGRSEAIHTFEDLGYFCIDNLPPALLSRLVELTALPGSRIRRVAVVCDMRSMEFFGTLLEELDKLEKQRAALPHPLPRGGGEGARQPLQDHAPPPPAVRERLGDRGHHAPSSAGSRASATAPTSSSTRATCCPRSCARRSGAASSPTA